jgi:ribonuclease J
MPEVVRISFLGGLGEIGRNCAVVEQAGRLVVLDCGVMFPNPEMPGVDLVLPDFTVLRERAEAHPRARGPCRSARLSHA